MKFYFQIFFIFLLKIHSTIQNVSIKCANNVTIGDLVLDDETFKNLSQILHDVLKINESRIHYSKLEVDNQKEILSSDLHPFISSVHLAYSNHLNLILTPDIIWYLIISGVSIHINKNAEKLRLKFVEHEGKKEIKIRRDNFILNSTFNDWDGVIDEFTDKIELNLKKDTKLLFNSNFSTTNRVNSICSKVVLMAAMEKYFSYTLTTLCGIPEIKLMGIKDDWVLMYKKIHELNTTLPSLSIWLDQLNDIVEKFIDVYDEKIDYDFWEKIYKVNGGSGGPYISGWVLALFPYLKSSTKNYFVWEKDWKFACEMNYMSGLVTSDFPLTLTNASFLWEYLMHEYQMSFLAGMIGIKYIEDAKTLQPVFGYAVIQN
ncbi:unnamed protein product [Brachionus calyciflorus]|uniref:DUF4419 domain-containing protein n=1 Tax=Brachionus calyciflorus TaxID=104777 RepID=A0A813Z0D1_9BILA|nr:unnamed protein product [Brachionus calyciflorus]